MSVSDVWPDGVHRVGEGSSRSRSYPVCSVIGPYIDMSSCLGISSLPHLDDTAIYYRPSNLGA